MEAIIIQDITSYFHMYFENAVMVGVCFAALKFAFSIIRLFIRKPEHYVKKWLRTLVSLPVDFAFGFYAYMVIAITFFSRIDGSADVVNLDLFSTFVKEPWHMRLIIENVIMFIPLGIFLRWYGLKKYWLAIFLFIGFSMSIETAQYLTRRGNLEVDDVFTNTLGGLIGFTLMKLICGVIYVLWFLINRLHRNKHS